MIRKAELKDLNDIMYLENIIFTSDKFSRRTYILLIKRNYVYLIFYKNKLAGFGSILINKLSNNTKKGRIYSVGILSEFRNKGLASSLIRYMEKQMGYIDYITLETHKNHKSVISLYEKLGYEKTEDLPNYYSDGDGIRMKKIIYKHLPDINYKTVLSKEMRYKDVGDWFDTKNSWEIRVPKLINIDYEFMILIHELVERYLVYKKGLSDILKGVHFLNL